jgi:hypothetical protein
MQLDDLRSRASHVKEQMIQMPPEKQAHDPGFERRSEQEAEDGQTRGWSAVEGPSKRLGRELD